jgi:hypothetical protein
MRIKPTVIAVVCFALMGSSPAALRAAEQPLQLQWSHLMPLAPPKLRSFLAPRSGTFDLGAVPHDGQPAPEFGPEGRWMSAPNKSAAPAPVVDSLDGKTVHIGGYVVPLDFDATTIKEFLLVPFVGACIHVPPPPANQIIYVKTEKGFDVRGSFDPVYVTGKMKVSMTFTGLADAGYSIDAEKVDHRAK